MNSIGRIIKADRRLRQRKKRNDAWPGEGRESRLRLIWDSANRGGKKRVVEEWEGGTCGNSEAVVRNTYSFKYQQAWNGLALQS